MKILNNHLIFISGLNEAVMLIAFKGVAKSCEIIIMYSNPPKKILCMDKNAPCSSNNWFSILFHWHGRISQQHIKGAARTRSLLRQMMSMD